MNNQWHDDALWEIAWKRRLTDAENAELRQWLAAHPEAESDWQAELALSETLRGLPDGPCSSNFTARVMDAALREPEPGKMRGLFRQLWRSPTLGWLPRIGFAVALGFAGVLAFQQVQQARQERFAWSVGLVSEVASLPGPDALRDFDAIRALDVSPRADVELLRLMQ